MREMRTRANLTQRELSAKLEKPQSFVAKCELGERRIDLIEWYWICEACDANPLTETKRLLSTFAKE